MVEAPPEDGGESPATEEGPKGGPTDITAAPGGEGGETGPSCTTDADCPADNVCEGKGCGEGEGVCAPKTGRMCTCLFSTRPVVLRKSKKARMICPILKIKANDLRKNTNNSGIKNCGKF